MKHELVLVVDFGGQYNQLIARRVRENNVYCEIIPYTTDIEKIKSMNPKGIIFTGGPNSAYLEDSPKIAKEIFEIGVPILGICYGIQVMSHILGGNVRKGTNAEKEYGKTEITYKESAIFEGISTNIVWMSHTDYISQVPNGFEIIGTTDACPCAAMQNTDKNIYAVQFHPEVTHSQFGSQMLYNFLYEVCGCKGDWVMDNFIENTVAKLREQIGDKKVILGLSGGVDSSVAAGLLSRAVGKQLTCVFVDQGLMRKNEGDFVEQTFTSLFDMNFVRVNCGDVFLEKLKGVVDPEQKRKIIGTEFFNVFWNEIRKQDELGYFAQGTIYPDCIESGKGDADVIKTHHNRVNTPDDVEFLGIIEPLADLFKDEVRKVGEKLGIPKELVWRQPFPGPGLAIRIIGEITEEKLDILRDADAIYREELEKSNVKADQYFAVLTDTKSVGVQGDFRTYDYTLALRAVRTSDFMTCEYAHIPYDILTKISSRITNEVHGINRIVYDITSKPPATIEWE